MEGLVVFAATLLLTAGVQQARFLSIAIRTLTTESLIFAGWVILWQPMETLLLGGIPIVAKRRSYEKLASMNVTVEAASQGALRSQWSRREQRGGAQSRERTVSSFVRTRIISFI